MNETPQPHNAPVKKNSTSQRIWLNTVIFSIFLFVILCAYYLIQGHSSDLFSLNILLAITGMVLIGLSYALSGITYFWNFADSKLIYRKQLGLAGFYLVLVHATFSFMNYFFIPNSPKPQFELGYTWNVAGIGISNIFAFIAGVTALAIFLFIALISTQYAMMALGGIRWRKYLRLGYIAYFIIVIHFGLKRYNEWAAWLSVRVGLPPLSLLLLIFVAFVLLLRLGLSVGLQGRKKPVVTGKQTTA